MIYFDIKPNKLRKEFSNEHSQFIDLDGTNIHYRREGSGPTIVLLHGTGSSLHCWEEWKKYLLAHFEVITLDLPAFGLTGPSSSRKYKIESYLKTLNKFFQKLNIKSFSLAGNSFGGWIAWSYAVSNPEQVKKLILVSSSGYPEGSKLPIIKLAQKPILGNLLKWISPKSIVKKNLLQSVYDSIIINKKMIDRYHKLVTREGNRQALIDRARTSFTDNSSSIQTIECPTLILWGLQDNINPVSMAYKFYKEICNSKLKIYEQCGHLCMEEIPKESAEAVISFMNS